MAWYAIATYEQGGVPRPALVLDKVLYDLAEVNKAASTPPAALFTKSEAKRS